MSVESSHSYSDVSLFYSEVRRVLTSGGCFLYTDVFPQELFAGHLNTLRELGFSVECDRDITRNVLRSCRETAAQRSAAFEGLREPGVIADFLSVPGSSVFEEMASSRAVYHILWLRKG